MDQSYIGQRLFSVRAITILKLHKRLIPFLWLQLYYYFVGRKKKKEKLGLDARVPHGSVRRYKCTMDLLYHDRSRVSKC